MVQLSLKATFKKMLAKACGSFIIPMDKSLLRQTLWIVLVQGHGKSGIGYPLQKFKESIPITNGLALGLNIIIMVSYRHRVVMLKTESPVNGNKIGIPVAIGESWSLRVEYLMIRMKLNANRLEDSGRLS